jgi:hypothetical protein
MKDSTALILASLVFNILTIWSVVIGSPVGFSAILCFSGAALGGIGLAHLARDK